MTTPLMVDLIGPPGTSRKVFFPLNSTRDFLLLFNQSYFVVCSRFQDPPFLVPRNSLFLRSKPTLSLLFPTLPFHLSVLPHSSVSRIIRCHP